MRSWWTAGVVALAVAAAAGAVLVLGAPRPKGPGRPPPGAGEIPAEVPRPPEAGAEEAVPPSGEAAGRIVGEFRSFFAGRGSLPPDAGEWREDPRVERDLRAILEGGGDLEERAAAALALARCRSDPAGASLVEAASGTYGAAIRTIAMHALVEAGDPKLAAEALAEIAARDADERFAVYATRALAYVPPEFSLPAFVGLLDQVNEPGRRLGIYQVLGGDFEKPDLPEAALAWNYRDRVAPIQFAEIRSEGPPVVADSLAGLFRRIETEPEGDLRREALRTLGRFRAEPAAESVRRVWERSDAAERREIVLSVAPEAESPAVGALAAAMPEVSDRDLRRVVAERLPVLEGRAALADLRRWEASETDPEIREMVRRAVDRLSE